MAIHVVRSGDSLWSVAQQYGVSVEAIMQKNGLTSQLLMPGIALYIPIFSLTPHFYTIQAEDTLYAIAHRYHSTVPIIMAANTLLDPQNLEVGSVITVPTPRKMTMTTLGFFVPYTAESFFNTIPLIASGLSFVAIAAYSFTKNGELLVQLEEEGMAEGSKELGVVPLLMIRNIFENGEFSSELVSAMLENNDARHRLIQNIKKYIEQNGYGGVSIDFEFIPPKNRSDFTSFLQQLKYALRGRILHVSVHAKTEDSLTNPITGGQDYKKIGAIADIVNVMTMDYGYPNGPPNPIAPFWWVEQVIRYTTSNIHPRKVQLSLPMYGYDWIEQTEEAAGISALEAQNEAIKQQVSVYYDEKEKAPYYTYWQDQRARRVWFEDIRSYTEKYKLAEYYRLLGVAFWEVRLPFPQNWAFIAGHVNVRKFAPTSE